MKHVFTLMLLLIVTVSFSQNTEEDKVEEGFVIEETVAKYDGGTPALVNFLSDNLQFSEADMGGLKAAKVYVGFTIEKTGEVTDVKIIRGVNEALDKEAVRIVKSMPYWIPGTQRGKRISNKLSLPINFRID
ncbi:energy transducer TonB [Xanthomarina gelatinilytica]|uniref:energy transducer TonB n=1 Tax=Flavobacteriaceae TaxID=49546 RepID=UPI003AA853C6